MPETDHTKAAEVFPEAYHGLVTIGSETTTIVEAAQRQKLPVLLKRYGTWVITAQGIHCLLRGMHVARERLHDREWIEQMLEESWLEFEDFCKALTMAQTMCEVGVI